MRIWIDGYEANVPQRLGSSQIAFNLLKTLERVDQKNEYTVLLPSPPMDEFPKERPGWSYKILKPRRLWTRIALPLALFTAKQRPDLIFSPTHYIPRFSPVKRVVTIFDLAYIHYPQMFKKDDLWKLNRWSGYSIKNADRVITISSSSKKDLINNYDIDRQKVTVAYPGYDHKIFRPITDKGKTAQVLDKYGIAGDYVIYVGTLQPRKNLIRLIESFQKIEHLKLVIVGKTTGVGRQGWMFEEILKKPEELGIKDKVIFTGFAPTEDLPYLISGSAAFVLPSLYEGFGIPAVEAMACGAPVIVSDTSSLPEAVGEAGLLVDPRSVTQIEQAVRTITSDQKLRQKKVKLGLKQAGKFSWEKMARTVLRVLEDTAKQS